jgi:hypothetical protein
MFSYFGQQAPADSGSSSEDEEQQQQASSANRSVETSSCVANNTRSVSVTDTTTDSNEDDYKVDYNADASQANDLLPTHSQESSLTLKLQAMEERNKKMTKQLSTLQGIITSKSSLYLEYKRKFEVSSGSSSVV